MLLYYAIATFAAQTTDGPHPAAPYHAIAFKEETARLFCAKIGEVMREIDKGERDNVIDLGTHRRMRGLRHIGAAASRLTERSEGDQGG